MVNNAIDNIISLPIDPVGKVLLGAFHDLSDVILHIVKKLHDLSIIVATPLELFLVEFPLHFDDLNYFVKLGILQMRGAVSIDDRLRLHMLRMVVTVWCQVLD